MNNLILPGVPIEKADIHPVHKIYLEEWREAAVQDADDGAAAASVCLQGALIDFVLFGKIIHDWLGVMDELLLSPDGKPIAYSESFAEKLHGFGGQYLQTTIASIHAKWWIDCATNGFESVDHEEFAALIDNKTDANTGLIFDHDISPTTIRHRMKTELTMSMALAVEIVRSARDLTDDRTALATALVDPHNCPPTGYMSTEYFRLEALAILGHEELFPVEIGESIQKCATDLDVGYCDFSMDTKFDAYMGTAKRTARDKPIHSPLTAHHVSRLLSQVEDADIREEIEARISAYREHLRNNPDNIPAFQMRDVTIPFGASITPIEAMCASHLIEA